MRIEYLDQDDIVSIVGAQLNIYDNAIKSIRSLNVPDDDHIKSTLEIYRDLTAGSISSSISDLLGLSNSDHKDLYKRIKAVLSDTSLCLVDATGKIVLIVLKYLKRALYDLEEELADRGQIVEETANGLDTKIDNLERAVAASINNK